MSTVFLNTIETNNTTTREEEEEEEEEEDDDEHNFIVYYSTIPFISLLVTCTFLGVMFRLFLLKIDLFNVTPILYPQMVGCFLIGIVNEAKDKLNGQYPILHLGLATGLCGSLTTFSSWILTSFELLLTNHVR